jgi:hypothetical protein
MVNMQVVLVLSYSVFILYSTLRNQMRYFSFPLFMVVIMITACIVLTGCGASQKRYMSLSDMPSARATPDDVCHSQQAEQSLMRDRKHMEQDVNDMVNRQTQELKQY